MTEIVQKIKTIRWQHLLILLLMVAVAAGMDSCSTSGKLTKKERKAQIEAAKKQLEEIINGTTTKTLEQQERTVNDIARKNLNDKDLNAMIDEARQVLKEKFADQEKIRQQKVDAARAQLLDLLVNRDNLSAEELEASLNKIKAQNLDDKEIRELIGKVEQKIASMKSSGSANIPLKDQLENAFQNIASSAKSGNSQQAESIIRKTLSLFSGDDAPVLIIISREGSIVDYDKPTTIRRYMDFLKDQKANRNDVDSYQLDANGKIKELDLIKK